MKAFRIEAYDISKSWDFPTDYYHMSHSISHLLSDISFIKSVVDTVTVIDNGGYDIMKAACHAIKNKMLITHSDFEIASYTDGYYHKQSAFYKLSALKHIYMIRDTPVSATNKNIIGYGPGVKVGKINNNKVMLRHPFIKNNIDMLVTNEFIYYVNESEYSVIYDQSFSEPEPISMNHFPHMIESIEIPNIRAVLLEHNDYYYVPLDEYLLKQRMNVPLVEPYPYQRDGVSQIGKYFMRNHVPIFFPGFNVKKYNIIIMEPAIGNRNKYLVLCKTLEDATMFKMLHG